jgi:hypothetical protein
MRTRTRTNFSVSHETNTLGGNKMCGAPKKFSLKKMCNAEMVGERGEIKPSCLKNILHNLQQCFGLEGTSVAFLFAHVLVKIVENFVNRAQVVLQVVLPGGTVIAQNADEHSSPAI